MDASRFPQIGLSGYEEKDKLREEFIDLQVSAGDLPQIQLYKAAGGSEKARVGLFWAEMGKLKTFDGEPSFPWLFQLCLGY